MINLDEANMLCLLQKQIRSTHDMLHAYGKLCSASGNYQSFLKMKQEITAMYQDSRDIDREYAALTARTCHRHPVVRDLTSIVDCTGIVIMMRAGIYTYVRVIKYRIEDKGVVLTYIDQDGNADQSTVRHDELSTLDGNTKFFVPYFIISSIDPVVFAGDMTVMNTKLCNVLEVSEDNSYFIATRIGEKRRRKYYTPVGCVFHNYKWYTDNAIESINNSDWNFFKVIALARALYPEYACDYHDSTFSNIRCTDDVANMFINPQGSVRGTLMMCKLIAKYIDGYKQLEVIREHGNYYVIVQVEDRTYKIAMFGAVVPTNHDFGTANCLGNGDTFYDYAKQRKCTETVDAVFDKYFSAA